jgi:cysteine synthase
MARLGLEKDIKDRSIYDRSVGRMRELGIVLPTFSQLADPARIPQKIKAKLHDVDADAPHPLNLFRVNWYNDTARRGEQAVPQHIVLPEALTGVKAKIVTLLGAPFPMIRAHKVLAAYGCLAPRVVTGQFDPTAHRALWPSTGNYCRGGVAISRIMGCRGVAILPENMSEERFRWLDAWCTDPKQDVIRTPGSESNVKEIYDKCNELDRDPKNIIFNQFCEFGNYLVHYLCTGSAIGKVFESLRAQDGKLNLRAYTSATGSGGTLAAGDFLKAKYGARIAALEALECPTLLANGFGEHNIQGIGDKHVPYIHNVMNTDFVIAVPEAATDGLGVLFNTDAGREYLGARRGLARELIDRLPMLGLSSICNILGAIKVAKHLDLGPEDVIATVATDSYEMYQTETPKAVKKYFGGKFDTINAGETFARYALGTGVDHMTELNQDDKNRVFNLGYFTWVEQQGVSVPEFQARRKASFWTGLHDLIPAWDGMIEEFNKRSGALDKL